MGNDESPENDPRPLCGPKRDRSQQPLGGSHVPENGNHEERNEPQLGEEGGPKALPVDEDEEGSFVSTARDAAADALRAAREKAAAIATATVGALEKGKTAFGVGGVSDTAGGGEACACASGEEKKDEVDLSPEEQFTRHRVDLEAHYKPPSEGPLVQIKHKAEHAVHAARAAVERRLRPPCEPSRLAFSSEGEAMPSGAQVELPRPREERSTVNAAQQADNAFPETLQEAIQTASSIDEPKAGTGPSRPREVQVEQGQEKGSLPAVDECGTDMVEPEPFGVTSGARSKL